MKKEISFMFEYYMAFISAVVMVILLGAFALGMATLDIVEAHLVWMCLQIIVELSWFKED